jgi:dihydrofolate synthase/folylpolyglutamate synthase
MNIEPAYQKTLDYLYSFVDYSLSRTFRNAPVNFNLDRLRKFASDLDNPQNDYPIIHVAGTKGKGSVSAMCTSVLRAGGYKVGTYTSPHLHDYAERIQVNGQPIPHEDLVSLVDELKPQIEAVPQLTTFEITTALAFVYFSRMQVDVAVVEVGLGGRLDATNIVMPVVSVITSLSYDHTYLLGNTLAEIAGEKGGIIKPEIPVVLAPQKDEARMVIERISAERSAPLTEVGRDYLFSGEDHSIEGQTMMVWQEDEQNQMDAFIETAWNSEWKPTRLKIPMLGYHQVENAATAYAALQIFRKSALPLSDEAICEGFSQVYWPGRFEVLRRDPPVVVDSAHNRDSAMKLRHTLDDYFPGQPVILVFGASEDKDLYGMFAELMPRIQQVIATKSFHPRAMDPELIVEMAHQFGKTARIIPDVADALEEALRITDKETLVLAAGSLFIAAGVREAWMARSGTVLEWK